ncbi:adenylate cyclase CyaB [Hetaerina americana]|uniref:adenylate cyclase CyaB n=1 Tax=Hetaerina americana TaxID=62018 RepID=UPI003A7F1E0C
MARNVEIKAKVRDLGSLIEKATGLSSSESVFLEQEDVFYQISTGRLKLRSEKGLDSTLIFYDRPDVEGPKLSNYEKCPISESEVPGIKRVLAKALGERGVVRKKRQLIMVGQTRVHVDSVEGLGDFMELEVMLEEHQSPEEGQEIAESLMEKLGIHKEDLLSGAYFDMLPNK